jgi:amidophosphoribosyltransferase
MAANNTVDEIRKYLNADSLHYLTQAGMVAATGQPAEAFCMACYNGNYPVAYDPLLDKHIIERRRKETQTLGEAAARENAQGKLLQV